MQDMKQQLLALLPTVKGSGESHAAQEYLQQVGSQPKLLLALLLLRCYSR